MRLVIRLQQHGYKNHPYWYLVVAPKYSNVRGKYIEQVGYWMPRKGKTFDRAIALNKNRIQYWLAMGAQPTEKISKFLSIVDMWPQPVVQFGSTTIYDKPQKQLKDSSNLNPYDLGPYKQFLGKVLEQEENSFIFRQAIQQQNYLQHFTNDNQLTSQLKPVSGADLKHSDSPDELQTEIDKLRDQLNDLQVNLSKVDQQRKQILIKRINELYKAWKQQQISNELKMIHSDSYDFEIKNNNIKQQLDSEKFSRKLDDVQQLIKSHQDMLTPITREEFKAYLQANSDFQPIKVETLIRQTFRQARENNTQVFRQDAYDLCNPDKKIQNISELSIKKNLDMDDKIFIPISKPVTPIPDITSYDPEDYYEIPKIFDPVQNANKPYDLPNINDVHIPRKPVRLNLGLKNNSGRKRPIRQKSQLYNDKLYKTFSTVQNNNQPSSQFKGAFMPYYVFKQSELQIFNNKN